MFTHAPIHRQVTTAHGCTVVVNLLHQLMRGDGVRNLGDFLGQALPLGHGDASVATIGPLFADERRPIDSKLALEVAQDRVYRVFAGVHGCAIGFDHVIAQRVTHALYCELLCIQLARAGMGSDFLVHQWLRERRGVLLVVPQFAEASDVHHHVLAELHAELQCQLRGEHHGFRIVTVDVQDGRLDHLHDVGTERAGTHVARIRRGEADLVVDDQVDRTTRGVATGLRQAQSFLVDTLATERRITVHQHGQHLVTTLVTTAVHAGADRTLHDRIDDFEVGRVERQRQVNRATGRGHIGTETLVVLHVTCGQIFRGGVVKFGKQVLRHLAHGVDQHVQTATVRHADDDFLHALGTCRLDELVHCSDEALTAFERETLLANVLGVEEALQTFSSGQPVQDVLLFVSREIGFAADALELLLPPALLVLVCRVHVLGTNIATVGFTQSIQQLTQRHGVFAEERVAGVENSFQVSVGETVKRRIEVRNVVALGTLQRIQIGPTGTHVTVSGNQLLRGNALTPHFGVRIGHHDMGGSLLCTLGKGIDDGLMRHIAGIRAVHSRDVLQRVKIAAPVIGHTTWIGKVVFVHLFDVRGVAAK